MIEGGAESELKWKCTTSSIALAIAAASASNWVSSEPMVHVEFVHALPPTEKVAAAPPTTTCSSSTRVTSFAVV